MESEAFVRPSSAILCGSPGALLDWVALGFARTNPGGYFWTDVRLPEQRVDRRGPLARHAIPPEQLSVVEPEVLSRNDAPANAAIWAVVSPSESAPALGQLADFLRLPSHTQRLIASRGNAAGPPVLVLSNAHRIAAEYPTESVGPLVRAIVGAGVSLFMTFSDEPPKGRLAFDNVWHLEAGDVSSWREAQLVVEAGTFGPPLTAGSKVPLSRISRLSGVLAELSSSSP